MFTGDIVEYHSSLLLRRRPFQRLGGTLDAFRLPPGGHRARTATRLSATRWSRPPSKTRATLSKAPTGLRPWWRRGGNLKDAWDAVREACDPKFADAIYEHCLPFNVARAFDEAKGIDTPRIWTAERDMDTWNAQNG